VITLPYAVAFGGSWGAKMAVKLLREERRAEQRQADDEARQTEGAYTLVGAGQRIHDRRRPGN
jgi:hypothetical protein